MAVSGDVTVAQDGGQGNVKLHPYLVTLVRWCVSCLWSTATVLLHRLMASPLQPITGPKPAPARAKIPKRVAGTEHLHPEPKVECQLLHQPANHTMDVIFVHGLYGSLGNTWRQGDWRQKYVREPQIVTLIDHSKPDTRKSHESSTKNDFENENKCVEQKIKSQTDLNDSDISIKKINEKLSKKIIPQENDLITEQFYNNTLLDQEDVYDTQAKFVSDMFKKETDCDTNCETDDRNSDNDNYCKYNQKSNFNNKHDNSFKSNQHSDNYNNHKYTKNDTYMHSNNISNSNNGLKYDQNGDNYDNKEMSDHNECKCNTEEKKCEVGCGCICNDCYSTCWPKDWIKMDFPGARVISINYTSDPYLWRPLWIKENKRLNLYQRAEQMIEQLVGMGVGDKPIIWVGHSKGGLFIKQIYCEAYDAYKKINSNHTTKERINKEIPNKDEEKSKESNGITAENIDTIIGHFSHDKENNNESRAADNNLKTNDDDLRTIDKGLRTNDDDLRTNDKGLRTNDKGLRTNDKFLRTNDDNLRTNNYIRTMDMIAKNNACVMNETVEFENIFEQTCANDNNYNLEYVNVIHDEIPNLRSENGKGADNKSKDVDLETGVGNHDLTSNVKDTALSRRAALWCASRGFMFYSVPHRGSPLADIKTPVTARSVDLLEIAKDCPLVLELHSRWQDAVCNTDVRVRSVVETTRTLMSVLWLRIVSTHSADAGIGTLSGISVDHREICKPRSRACRLYTMLTSLIHDTTCTCQ